MADLPIKSVRDPRHANHKPPSSPRCPAGECVAMPFTALCPKCDHPVNVPRDDVEEPWQLRHESSSHG